MFQGLGFDGWRKTCKKNRRGWGLIDSKHARWHYHICYLRQRVNENMFSYNKTKISFSPSFHRKVQFKNLLKFLTIQSLPEQGGSYKFLTTSTHLKWTKIKYGYYIYQVRRVKILKLSQIQKVKSKPLVKNVLKITLPPIASPKV